MQQQQQHHAGGGGGGGKRPPPAARGEAERKADEAVVGLLRRLQRSHKEGQQQQQQEQQEGQELELNGLGLQRLPGSLLRHLELETGHHNGASGLSLGHRLRRLSLRSNLLSSLPRELIYLRNLEVLNLDGNRLESLCAEVLRVPTAKRYPIPRDVSAGGGEAVLSYLRAYERVAREQKLPLRFDHEAHYQRSTIPKMHCRLCGRSVCGRCTDTGEAPPIPFLDREWERVQQQQQQQQQHDHPEAVRRTVCHECADALHASPLKKSFEVAPVLSRVRTFDEVFDALSKGPTKEGAAPYNGSGSRRISLSMDRGENGGSSSSRPPRSGPLGNGAPPLAREGRQQQQQQGREEAAALAARLREVEGQLSARDDDVKAARRKLAEAREQRHRESDQVRELTQALEEAQERAARADREAQRREAEKEREAAVAELRQKAHEWRMREEHAREEALRRQAEHARKTEEALLAQEAERRKRTHSDHATAIAALQDRIDELQARLADAQAQLLKANNEAAAASKDVVAPVGGAGGEGEGERGAAAAAPSSTQPGALSKAAAAEEELARVVAERARLEERLKDARGRVMEVIEESGAAVAEERRRVKELEDLNFQQRKKIADLAARLELSAAGCPPSTATTATSNVAAESAASAASAKREEGLLAEKELVRLRERTRDLEHALERKGRRESQMIVQLQHLEMREREREEAERRTREHEAVCAEWTRKEALARQERERLQAALADEARQRREERERERAKTQRMVRDLETLEAQLEQLRVRQADHQRLEARARDLDALRATLEARVADLEARLRGEGRAESEVVTDLRARLDAADQRHADVAAQLAQATLGRDSLQTQVHALQRQLDHSTAQAREQLAHLQARLAEVQQPAAAAPSALTLTEGGPPAAAAAAATAGEAPPPARSVSDRTLVGKPSASLESKRSMSLEETARRIKHLKQELKNAKKAKKVLKRSSSRGSSRGSSDSLSSSTDDDESELESDFSETETETETETDEASDAEDGEGGAGNAPSSSSGGKSRKKRLGKWGRLSISNVRDLASRDSSSSSAKEAAASSGGSSALPPATASSATTGKAITRHKRSLSFLAGRKKSTDSASASSSDDDSEASELDTESENEGEAKEKKQKASESTGRPQRGHRRSHSLLGGMTKFLPGGDDGKAGEKDDGREKEKEKAREEKERKRREKEQKRKEREELIRQLKKEERQERKKEREKKGRTSRKKPLKGREVFGVGIKELCEKDPTHPIPQVVKLIAEYLESSGAMEVEGLFRVPGQSMIMSRLKDDFDAAGLGNEAAVAASFLDYDSHDVAGLLKLFLKMLPEPVMTYALYDDFVRLQVEFEKKGGDDTASVKAEHLANFVALLRKLPPDNLRFFLFLAKFLHKVSLVSEKNKMSAGNLAIVFAPNVLCPATPDLNYQMRMPTLSALVEFAIAHAYALAMHLDNTAKPKPAAPVIAS
ncbi:RhoGAP domain containing protein [Acanthamoeba castellanii str. Neff]|uniref:RhoGAP domain containing protein n=1 Tax=Acanthamoeba castellanii (strain ATCC 30010 / Neff) TaxID=1257118 RepID=L8H1Y5_ACACF|nr:RhoGAP domain containing protein [Acanthamoeba castellanii str. Neff]ELR19504.1 RhoGAP domain containing protein [Acanthamoeba castellanii str. Neff]